MRLSTRVSLNTERAFAGGTTTLLADRDLTVFDTGLGTAGKYVVGDGIVERLPSELRRYELDGVFLVTSGSLRERFGDPLVETLAKAGFPVSVLTVGEGELSKSWEALAGLCEDLIGAGVSKNSVIIGLGGGMVSNLAGLAAGLTFRGVRYIDMPTTLMAITDGGLSNKQAINGRRGKNQFGMYFAPLFTWADVAYVRHEPARQLRSAIVEAVKNGFIDDPAWLDQLSDLLDPTLERVRDGLLELSLAIIRSKLAILRKDPTERALGVILEYGHTIGHAVEWLAQGRLLHGEAIAIGMCAAARIGIRLGITPPEVLRRQEHVLVRLLGCDIAVPATLSPERIMEAIVMDNKRMGDDDPRFVLLEEVGRPHLACGDYLLPVSQTLVKSVLADA